MAFVKIFLVLSLASVGFTYDVELTANVMLKKDILAKVLRDQKASNINFNVELPQNWQEFVGLPKNQLKIVRSGPVQEEPKIKETTTTEAKIPESTTTEARVQTAIHKQATTSEDNNTPWVRSLQQAPQLVKHLIKKSLDRQRAAARDFEKLMTNHMDISNIVNVSMSNYLKKYEKHISNLLKKNPSNQIEKDIILLDVVDSSNRFLKEGTLQILRYIIDKGLFSNNDNVDAITNALYLNSQLQKHEDFKFLCKKMHLCKPYPGFSDHLAEVLNEVIKLSDGNLHTLIMKTIRILKNKQHVTTNILGKHLADILDKYLQNIIDGDLTGIRNTLSILRDNINERYTWKDIFDKVQMKRTKSMKILLDIVDVAFDDGGAGIVSMHSNSMIKAIKHWQASNAQDLENTVYSFFSYIADTITNCWVGDTMFEVRALVTLILTGELNNFQKYKYLLTSGSNFVNKSTDK